MFKLHVPRSPRIAKSIANRVSFCYNSSMKTVVAVSLLLVLLIIILIPTSSARAVRYDQGDWVNFSEFRYVTSIAADQQVVYFGTTGGITRYDTMTDSWLTPITTADGLPSGNIEALVYDIQYNELWVSTDRGNGKYNLTFESWYNDSDFPSEKIKNDWRASRFSDMFMPFRYNYSNGVITDPDGRRYKVTVGYEDGDFYRMYVGTWGMGAAVINTDHFDYTILRFGLYDKNISRVIEIGDDLWMGTEFGVSDKAITRFDRYRNEWNYYRSEFVYGLDNTEITSGVQAGDYIWLGTSTGLIRIDKGDRFTTYRNYVNLPSTEIYSLANYGGYLYIGTDNGLTVLPATGNVPDSAFRAPLPDDLYLRGQVVYDLCVFKDVLYIATDRKVYSYDARANRFHAIDNPIGDLGYGVYDIFGNGISLYFGARFGVAIYDPDTEEITIATEHSFSTGWKINEVYADDKHIWAATDIGLWKYRRSDQYTYLYTIEDGLPANAVNSLVPDGDYFWLGTSEGLIRFFWNDPGRGD